MVDAWQARAQLPRIFVSVPWHYFVFMKTKAAIFGVPKEAPPYGC